MSIEADSIVSELMLILYVSDSHNSESVHEYIRCHQANHFRTERGGLQQVLILRVFQLILAFLKPPLLLPSMYLTTVLLLVVFVQQRQSHRALVLHNCRLTLNQNKPCTSSWGVSNMEPFVLTSKLLVLIQGTITCFFSLSNRSSSSLPLGAIIALVVLSVFAILVIILIVYMLVQKSTYKDLP